MSATAEKAAPAKTDGAREIVELLEDRELAVAELLAATSELALSVAWSRGDVEFGARARVLNGKPGAPDSRLIVEPTWEWTGPKRAGRVDFRRLHAEHAKGLPDAGGYWLYPDDFVPSRDEPDKSPLKKITRAEAEKLLALHVRLTDKGLAALQAS